jgi:hypothetical protein
MKKHLTTYAFIAALVMGFAGNVAAEQCSANMKKGTCSQQNGKGKNPCEDIWDKGYADMNYTGDQFTHCKWVPGATQALGVCVASGKICLRPYSK